MSSAAWNPIPEASPSNAQSVAANRLARPGAKNAMTARGTSLRLSSITAAIATDGPAEPTSSPRSPAMRWQRNAIANAHSAVSENSRKIEDHRSVFVGASSSQPRSMSEHASHTSTPRSNLSMTARAISTTTMAGRR